MASESTQSHLIRRDMPVISIALGSTLGVAILLAVGLIIYCIYWNNRTARFSIPRFDSPTLNAHRSSRSLRSRKGSVTNNIQNIQWESATLNHRGGPVWMQSNSSSMAGTLAANRHYPQVVEESGPGNMYPHTYEISFVGADGGRMGFDASHLPRSQSLRGSMHSGARSTYAPSVTEFEAGRQRSQSQSTVTSQRYNASTPPPPPPSMHAPMPPMPPLPRSHSQRAPVASSLPRLHRPPSPPPLMGKQQRSFEEMRTMNFLNVPARSRSLAVRPPVPVVTISSVERESNRDGGWGHDGGGGYVYRPGDMLMSPPHLQNDLSSSPSYGSLSSVGSSNSSRPLLHSVFGTGPTPPPVPSVGSVGYNSLGRKPIVPASDVPPPPPSSMLPSYSYRPPLAAPPPDVPPPPPPSVMISAYPNFTSSDVPPPPPPTVVLNRPTINVNYKTSFSTPSQIPPVPALPPSPSLEPYRNSRVKSALDPTDYQMVASNYSGMSPSHPVITSTNRPRSRSVSGSSGAGSDGVFVPDGSAPALPDAPEGSIRAPPRKSSRVMLLDMAKIVVVDDVKESVLREAEVRGFRKQTPSPRPAGGAVAGSSPKPAGSVTYVVINSSPKPVGYAPSLPRTVSAHTPSPKMVGPQPPPTNQTPSPKPILVAPVAVRKTSLPSSFQPHHGDAPPPSPPPFPPPQQNLPPQPKEPSSLPTPPSSLFTSESPLSPAPSSLPEQPSNEERKSVPIPPLPAEPKEVLMASPTSSSNATLVRPLFLGNWSVDSENATLTRSPS
ncbi:hypothetical protein HDU97_006090 [Phlyctochytrium planicorne]|nr:hypothetical protein HDU97_006090 [Phlyctochytrium planicorne]